MKKILTDKAEMDARVFVFPTSSIQLNAKKINYFDFISSLENSDCNEALRRIVPEINMDAIKDMIYDIDCISETMKKFYYSMLMNRKEKILDYSLKKLSEL